MIAKGKAPVSAFKPGTTNTASPPAVTLKHLKAPHGQTTIKLETEFWSAITMLAEKAGQSWQQWALVALADKPAGTGAVSWLRVQCLTQSIQGATHG